MNATKQASQGTEGFSGTEHLHFLQAQNGGYFCIDIVWLMGQAIGVGWYGSNGRDIGQTDLPTTFAGKKA